MDSSGFFSKLFDLYQHKWNQQDQEKQKAIAKMCISLLEGLQKELSKTNMQILNELAKYLSDCSESDLIEKLSALNYSQEKILLDSMDEHIDKIKKIISELQTIALEQEKSVLGKDKLTNMILQEKRILNDLKHYLAQENELEDRLKRDISLVKKMEHSEWFIKLIKGTSKLFVKSGYDIVVKGLEKIPNSGPVVLAPRHYNVIFDPALFYSIINRRVFFLGATDFMNEGFTLKDSYFFSKMAYNFLGTISVNRPVAPKNNSDDTSLRQTLQECSRVLLLNQALVVFPESFGEIKRGEREILGLYNGLFHFVDYAQKKNGVSIPIIPIGTLYTKTPKKTIFVNIGDPMYIPVSDESIDFNPYTKKLFEQLQFLTNSINEKKVE